MRVRISLILEASVVVLCFNFIFSLDRADAILAILEIITGLDPSLEMIDLRYFKFSAAYNVWLFIFVSLCKPVRLFIISFVLSGPVSTVCLLVLVSRRSAKITASSFSSALTKIMTLISKI